MKGRPLPKGVWKNSEYVILSEAKDLRSSS